mmetsp:Transcript_1234/g.2038  ORF Transcript_1234/g.2038 Transcript_1234/m.2038 type:complete len:275 (+) Transcript_1234:723-1547(+)
MAASAKSLYCFFASSSNALQASPILLITSVTFNLGFSFINFGRISLANLMKPLGGRLGFSSFFESISSSFFFDAFLAEDLGGAAGSGFSSVFESTPSSFFFDAFLAEDLGGSFLSSAVFLVVFLGDGVSTILNVFSDDAFLLLLGDFFSDKSLFLGDVSDGVSLLGVSSEAAAFWGDVFFAPSSSSLSLLDLAADFFEVLCFLFDFSFFFFFVFPPSFVGVASVGLSLRFLPDIDALIFPSSPAALSIDNLSMHPLSICPYALSIEKLSTTPLN